MQLQEAEKALCRELNIDWNDVNAGTNDLFSISDLDDSIVGGAKRAWDYKPWTFTEGSYSTTAPNPTTPSYAYPSNFEDEGIFLVIVNGVPWTGRANGKRDFADYMRYLAINPNDALSLIWTEYARNYYLNPAAYSAGQSINLYGKLRIPSIVNPADLLPFSPSSDTEENSGNKAIVILAYSDILDSDKKQDHGNAKIQEARAIALLDSVWAPMAARKAGKRPLHQPFFNTQNYFPNGRTMGGDTNIGNFP